MCILVWVDSLWLAVEISWNAHERGLNDMFVDGKVR